MEIKLCFQQSTFRIIIKYCPFYPCMISLSFIGFVSNMSCSLMWSNSKKRRDINIVQSVRRYWILLSNQNQDANLICSCVAASSTFNYTDQSVFITPLFLGCVDISSNCVTIYLCYIFHSNSNVFNSLINSITHKLCSTSLRTSCVAFRSRIS